MENSNTPWTPGSWVAEEADFFGDHNIILADSAGDSSAIAAVVSNLRPALEVANNARLIAAAPEMAALIQKYADAWEAGTGTVYLIDEAKALLSRIEGEKAAILKGEE